MSTVQSSPKVVESDFGRPFWNRCFMVAPLVLIGTKARLTIINAYRHDIEIPV